MRTNSDKGFRARILDRLKIGKKRSTSTIDIAITAPQEFLSPSLFDVNYTVHELWKIIPNEVENLDIAARVRGLVATGPVKIDAGFLDRFPALEFIANFGSGYDRIDIKAAIARGLVVSNTPDILTEDVADLAIGLLLSLVREIPRAEQYLRQGRWSNGPYPLTSSLQGRRIGIIGLGRIGRSVAKRCDAFGLELSYYSRTPKPDLHYTFFPSLTELAGHVDTLIVTVSGTEETRGLVNEAVIGALGPEGILINVSRGYVVDETALIHALRSNLIRGAGLDVFASEPHVPRELLELDNAVLLPHIGSASRKTRQGMVNLLVQNIEHWFGHGHALTPVPESVEMFNAKTENAALGCLGIV